MNEIKPETLLILVFFTQCYLKHCQPGTLQGFIRIHLHLSCLGEHWQFRHSGTGCECTLVERRKRKGGRRARHGFSFLHSTYFQSDKAGLLLGSVWVYFDCLAGLELLQVCKPVACLNCTLASVHTVEEAHRGMRQDSH